MTHDDVWGWLEEAFEADGITDFAPDEFVPRRVLVPPVGYIHRIPLIARVGQDLRDASGGVVNVNSAYRDSAYNKRIGGATKSWHVQACAADYDSLVWRPKEVYEWLEGHPWSHFMGLGRYRTFTHCDVRGFFGGVRARWDNRERDIS